MAESAAKPKGARKESRALDALVIGAGFAGLYQLHCLRDRLGLRVQVLEAGDGVGGTWYWNRYPGARCDSESHAYCYSFSKALRTEWQWSERYPGQAEIMRYLAHVADTLDLRRDIAFNERVVDAAYDDKANLWRVKTESGKSFVARLLIAAVGCLSTANVPKIKGLETFAGEWYHTGNWPHQPVDFTGKRVAQIGTGSTGIQSAPVIAETAEHLYVLQRTANYSVPARNVPLTPAMRKDLQDRDAEFLEIMRTNTNGHPFRISERRAFDVDADERLKLYEQSWERGGLQFRGVFGDMVTDKKANDTAAEFLRNKIRQIVKDPETARLLSDIDHPYGAKRPPIDTNYFETFNRKNVTLVDVRTDPIVEITPEGVRTKNATYPVDIIVLATGFDAMTGPLLRLNVRGKGGLALSDVWKDGPRNYLGLQVPGFPNLFTMTGPGSPSVLTNMPVAIEQHVEWITDCIDYMRRNGMDRIEATEQATSGWVKTVNDAANATLLPTVPHSWYLGANVPGKPKVFMPYAGGLARYRSICNDIASNGYRGFDLSRSA
jgi:cation diffusion facilitator CzcD-associated flavoprotein CzcO